ncbi:transporter substrate-binding domain-containing protein [Chitinibacter sp. SCUT-21]|uniref:substrate-binding periplasmic protein n=1 Tax=Chitinibacter sp. SCUT-21 TaxID=2970891 RepID=UPI0035A59087
MRVFSALLFLSFSTLSLAQGPIKLVTIVPLESPTGQVQVRFINDLFARIHTPVQLVFRPAKRAELEFKAGHFDGDAGRTGEFAKQNPSALRVEPSFFSLPVFAITRELKITQWSELYGRKVGYIRGVVLVENQLQQRSPLSPSDSASACVRMLKARRIDVCILSAGIPPDAEFTQAKPALVLSEFTHLTTHLWLLPRHQPLARQLSSALKSMQKDGSLPRYQQLFRNPPPIAAQ